MFCKYRTCISQPQLKILTFSHSVRSSKIPIPNPFVDYKELLFGTTKWWNESRSVHMSDYTVNKWWRKSSVKTSVKQNHTESTVARANSPRVKRPEREAKYIHLVMRCKMCVVYFHSTVFGTWWLDREADILSQAMCNWKCSNKRDFLCVLCMQQAKKTFKQVPVRNLYPNLLSEFEWNSVLATSVSFWANSVFGLCTFSITHALHGGQIDIYPPT